MGDDHFMETTDIIGKRLISQINFEKGEVFEREGTLVDLWGGAVL